MALSIDASSPATFSTGSTGHTATSASFTPPAGSLILIMLAGDGGGNVNEPAPTITDSLGTHLTYTLQQEASPGTLNHDGVAAIWTAPVVTSAAMTITVTNNASGTPAGVGRAVVLTDTGTPGVGASAVGGPSAATTAALSYTATVTGSWGFGVVSDWSSVGVETAGSGTTLIASALSSSTSTGSSIEYGFHRRTTADGVATSTTTLNVTFPANWTDGNWIVIEILPNAGAASSIPPSPIRLPQGRDLGETWWIQRDRSNANLVGTAANPLPMPLAVAFGDDQQKSASRWPLPLAATAVYAQKDRRNAVLVGSGSVAADPLTLPDAVMRQRVTADFVDRREVPQQRLYVSDPLLLNTALLEDALIGGATIDLRTNVPATHADRREVPQQRSALIDESTVAPIFFDPTLCGSSVAELMPATHVDRREVPAQRITLSASDDILIVGTGALGAWWSEDSTAAFMYATMPHATDPSLLVSAGVPFDVTLAVAFSRLIPATHADRREVPQQRFYVSDPLLIVEDAFAGGATIDLRTNVPATHADRREVPQQRLYISDPSTYPTSLFTDPLGLAYGAGGLYWMLYNQAALNVDRREVPQQRLVLADPTLQPQSDPVLFASLRGRVAVTWPAERREVAQQRPYVSDPSTYPTSAPTDPLGLAYGVGGIYWMIYNGAALSVDRREVPQQRLYRSDPSLLNTALLEDALIGGATIDLRTNVPATHADRREVPTQLLRQFSAAATLANPITLGYLPRRTAETWPTLDARSWRPQQRFRVSDPILTNSTLLQGTLTITDSSGTVVATYDGAFVVGAGRASEEIGNVVTFYGSTFGIL